MPLTQPHFLTGATGHHRVSRSLLAWAPWVVVAVMTLAFAIGFSWLSLARHAAFQSHAFDLGNMDQAAWNTVHGRFLRFTDMTVGPAVLTTRLAIHVEPLLALLSLLYLFHSGPESLLIAQATVVAAGAIPAFLLARRVVGNEWLALAFPAAYLLHPSLQNAVLDDFHPVTMSACFVLWAIHFLYRDALIGFGISALIATATKEEVGLLIAFLGLWLMFRRKWQAGVAAVLGGVGWFAISVLLIIPASNPSGHSPYLSRYYYLGHGIAEVLLSPLRHPGTVLQTLVSSSRLSYLTDLFHPVGYVSMLAIPAVLLALPGFLVNMLSADSHMYSGFYQYSAELVPYVIVSSIFGIGFVARLAARRNVIHSDWIVPALCGLVLVASLVDTRRYGFSPLADGFLVPSSGPHQALERRLVDSIPIGAPVAASDEIEPHLSSRKWAYLLPTFHPRNGPAAEYIALDASIPSSPIEPHTLRDTVSQLLRGGYGVAAAADGVLVLRRGAPSRTLPAAFDSFMFPATSPPSPILARWGPLTLVGATVHPRSRSVNRSRPAIEVEMYWRASHSVPPGVEITVYFSPVYSGARPRFSDRWHAQSDSPTPDWLPMRAWPIGRTIRVSSLPFTPTGLAMGSVDIAIAVSRLSRAIPASVPVIARTVIRVATIDVQR